MGVGSLDRRNTPQPERSSEVARKLAAAVILPDQIPVLKSGSNALQSAAWPPPLTHGLTFLFEASNPAFFDCGVLRLMLTISETPESTCSSVPYYETADIQAPSNGL
jgi:hypothetical protein